MLVVAVYAQAAEIHMLTQGTRPRVGLTKVQAGCIHTALHGLNILMVVSAMEKLNPTSLVGV
jgi:hypothetical protein